MTKRVQIKKHIQTLDEINSIMTAMKNLSLIEINKGNKNIANQERVFQTINNVGADFLDSYPESFANIRIEKPIIYILIGSERGFCGGINENIIQKLKSFENNSEKYIVIGRKLSVKLTKNPQLIKVFDGPNAVEEIPAVILNLILYLGELNIYANQWAIIYNVENQNKTQTLLLRPFKEFKRTNLNKFSFPPVMNLTQENFLFDFINQYLFSLLYFIFYKSFISENYQRLRHLEKAIDCLEKQKTVLKRHLNLLRQDEITEEIQIIMLSTEAIIEELSSLPNN